jgi:hypothetical protein
MEQPRKNKAPSSQPSIWSAAELRRVARILELLINIDKRKERNNNANK